MDQKRRYHRQATFNHLNRNLIYTESMWFYRWLCPQYCYCQQKETLSFGLQTSHSVIYYLTKNAFHYNLRIVLNNSVSFFNVILKNKQKKIFLKLSCFRHRFIYVLNKICCNFVHTNNKHVPKMCVNRKSWNALYIIRCREHIINALYARNALCIETIKSHPVTINNWMKDVNTYWMHNGRPSR